MAGGPGGLYGMIELDGDHVWNGSGIIENLVSSFKSQIGDWQIALIYND